MEGRCLAALGLALLVAVLAAPAAVARDKSTVPDGFYGVMWDRSAMTAPAALQEAQFALMRRSGVETVRTAFSWEDAQPHQHEPTNFAPTDRLVELAARHRIELLPVIIYTPFWARIDYYAGFSSRPRQVGAYARFVEELVHRYGPSGTFWDERPDLPRRPLRYWQIWNEPNLPIFWWTARPGRWMRSYGRLLNASYDAVKRADPGAKVVLGALANDSWRELRRLYRSKEPPRFDVAAINLFTSSPGNILRGLRRVRAVLNRAGDADKPLWLTETTWPATGHLLGSLPIPDWDTTAVGMATKLARLYALAARHHQRLELERVYWYTWASDYSSSDPFDYSGLVRWTGRRFVPEPALDAFSAAARR